MRLLLLLSFSTTLLFASDFRILIDTANKNYENEKYYQAIVCFNEAKKYANYTQWAAIDKNVERILTDNKLNFILSNKDLILNSFLKYTASFSLSLIKLFFLILWYTLFILLIFFGFKKKQFAIFSIFGILIFFPILLFLKSEFINSEYGISKSINLRVGPSQDFHEIGILSEGSWLKILKKNEDWYFIKSNDLKGWLKRDDIYLS